jgi:hypothetical protein
MRVIWEKRGLKPGLNGRLFNLVAVLVDSYQENGKKEERIIEDLSTIEEKFLATKARDMRAFHQGIFWAVVDKKLKNYILAPEVRTKIEEKISETVPRPNDDWPLWSVTCIPRYDP